MLSLIHIYLFIEGTVSTDRPETPERFAAAGEAFGRFQRQLGGFDASISCGVDSPYSVLQFSFTIWKISFQSRTAWFM